MKKSFLIWQKKSSLVWQKSFFNLTTGSNPWLIHGNYIGRYKFHSSLQISLEFRVLLGIFQNTFATWQGKVQSTFAAMYCLWFIQWLRGRFYGHLLYCLWFMLCLRGMFTGHLAQIRWEAGSSFNRNPISKLTSNKFMEYVQKVADSNVAPSALHI